MSLARRIILPVVLGLSVMAPAPARENPPTMGRSIETLARVKMTSRNGANILLGSRISQGKPTLVSIWATWCLPCVVEAPYLDKIRKDLGSGYNFVYINRSEGNPDPNQPPAAIAQYLARAGMGDIDYVVADVNAYRQIVGADMANIPDGLVGIPRVYLFDRNGRQIYTRLGFTAAGGVELEQRVRQAMAD
jgi:thiol-disulfide isomerase/thioredoxin